MLVSRFFLGAAVLSAAVVFGSIATHADTDMTKYPLGASPMTLHDKLIADRFVFEKFTDKQIVAIKRTAKKAEAGEEFPDILESTKIIADICSGKVFRLKMDSYYGGKFLTLLFGRKLFYDYLKKNDAVNSSLNINKNKTNTPDTKKPNQAQAKHENTI